MSVPMDWWAPYIGLPFAEIPGPGEAHCWSLVCMVYRDMLGTILPDYGEIAALDLVRVASAMRNGQDIWYEPDSPREFDLVGMRVARTGAVAHVGVLVGRNLVLHIEQATHSVAVPLDHWTIKDRIIGFRRLRSLG